MFLLYLFFVCTCITASVNGLMDVDSLIQENADESSGDGSGNFVTNILEVGIISAAPALQKLNEKDEVPNVNFTSTSTVPLLLHSLVDNETTTPSHFSLTPVSNKTTVNVMNGTESVDRVISDHTKSGTNISLISEGTTLGTIVDVPFDNSHGSNLAFRLLMQFQHRCEKNMASVVYESQLQFSAARVMNFSEDNVAVKLVWCDPMHFNVTFLDVQNRSVIDHVLVRSDNITLNLSGNVLTPEAVLSLPVHLVTGESKESPFFSSTTLAIVVSISALCVLLFILMIVLLVVQHYNNDKQSIDFLSNFHSNDIRIVSLQRSPRSGSQSFGYANECFVMDDLHQDHKITEISTAFGSVDNKNSDGGRGSPTESGYSETRSSTVPRDPTPLN